MAKKETKIVPQKNTERKSYGSTLRNLYQAFTNNFSPQSYPEDTNLKTSSPYTAPRRATKQKSKSPKINLNHEIQQEILTKGLNKGLENITDENPFFRGKENLLNHYISSNGLEETFKKAYALVREDNPRLNPNEFYSKLTEQVAEYVSNGLVFDEKGKEFILKQGLKEQANKSGFWNIFSRMNARKVLKQESYINQAIDSFGELYSLMKSGDYQKQMPEIAEKITEVYDAGFFNAAADILYSGNLLDNKKYNLLKESIHSKVKENVEYTTNKIQDYLKRAAIFLLGLVGLTSVFLNNSLTGNVIGNSTNSSFGLIGGALLFVGSLFLLFKLRKKTK